MDKQLDEILAELRSVPAEVRRRYVFERCRHDFKLFERVTMALDSGEHIADDQHEPGSESSTAADVIVSAGARYTLIDVIGEGSSAIVYLADQTEPVRRRVALKVIKLGTHDVEELERFSLERQVMASVSHPGIARVYEAGNTDAGRPFFAMEYVPGQTLAEYCNRSLLDIRERVKMFLTVCNAVQHVHTGGIVHRDLKPSNIVVTHTDGRAVAKIIDFGVACRVGQPADRGIVGSLSYMSPEQVRPGPEGIDTRADIYALGAILYELVSGRPPIDTDEVTRDGYAATAERIVSEVPPRASELARELRSKGPSDRRASVPQHLFDDIDSVLTRALEKDRRDRYQTVVEFSSDLERILRGAPVSVGPRSITYVARRFVGRHKAVVAGFAVILAALLVSTVINTIMLIQNRRATRIAEEQSQQILALSDVVRLETMINVARGLVPAYPDRADAMEGWLDLASRELGGRLPLHRARLRELRGGGTDGQNVVNRETELLRNLVRDLETFLDPDPSIGLVSRMQQRLAMSRAIEPASTGRYAAEWQEAVRAIADTARFPQYGGLVISPQIGLVPLGPDEHSGLMEFAHVATGDVPSRDKEGRLVMTGQSGIVMILIPGGSFWMGATNDPDEAARTTGVVDRDAEESESPPHRVYEDPFFISKFEVTWGQWKRLTGDDDRRRPPGTVDTSGAVSLLHPVQDLDWDTADWWMRLIGLELPTESQWEYAVRAGSVTPYWWGNDPHLFAERENVLDQAALASGTKPPTYLFAPWNDGYAGTSPVGSFLPNAFGLHDGLGNVREWTRGHRLSYRTNTSIPDTRVRDKAFYGRMSRGGGENGGYLLARATKRIITDPSSDYVGVRPARRIEP